MIWDLYILERIKTRGNTHVERWRRQQIDADDADGVVARIRDRGVHGTFKAYPVQAGVSCKAHMIEVYEVERLR